jgi:hypothetical protein
MPPFGTALDGASGRIHAAMRQKAMRVIPAPSITIPGGRIEDKEAGSYFKA